LSTVIKIDIMIIIRRDRPAGEKFFQIFYRLINDLLHQNRRRDDERDSRTRQAAMNKLLSTYIYILCKIPKCKSVASIRLRLNSRAVG